MKVRCSKFECFIRLNQNQLRKMQLQGLELAQSNLKNGERVFTIHHWSYLPLNTDSGGWGYTRCRTGSIYNVVVVFQNHPQRNMKTKFYDFLTLLTLTEKLLTWAGFEGVSSNPEGASNTLVLGDKRSIPVCVYRSCIWPVTYSILPVLFSYFL